MTEECDVSHAAIGWGGAFGGGLVGILAGVMLTRWLANKELKISLDNLEEACKPKTAYYTKATYVGGSELKNNLIIEDYSGEKFLLLLGTDGVYKSLSDVGEDTLEQNQEKG